jgi:cysteinyl-tRNA synthetase
MPLEKERNISDISKYIPNIISMERIAQIKLFNTLGRELQDFVPIVPGKVGMYTCGPTVYSRAHIGNMRAYISADIIRRVFEYAGYEVKQVMNITDVGHLTSDADEGEDKMQKAARETHQTAWEVSKIWTSQFFKDVAELNVQPAHIICKATDYINEQIALVQRLEKKGFTYLTSDGVYYDTSKFLPYADFAKLDIKGLQAGKRIEMGEKRNKTDFALWKFSKPEEKRDMEWDSPWGRGFPGWHIECSAMSMKYLGETFDVHTGGVDHIPIHHTNEIAQSEGAMGSKFVNYWLHSEFLVMSGKEKMGKSLGNIVNLDTLKERGITPMSYRYLCLNTHYRKQMTYGGDILESAKSTYEGLVKRVADIRDHINVQSTLEDLPERAQQYLQDFRLAVFNDFNTPQGLAIMWNVLKDTHLKQIEKYTLLRDFDKVLGLKFDEMGLSKETAKEVPQEVNYLLSQRNAFRASKEWKKADEVRDKLKSRGYLIKDTSDGSRLERI